MLAKICSRQHMQTDFSDVFFVGILRVTSEDVPLGIRELLKPNSKCQIKHAG